MCSCVLIGVVYYLVLKENKKNGKHLFFFSFIDLILEYRQTSERCRINIIINRIKLFINISYTDINSN